MAFTAVLWASRHVLQGSLPGTGKPHSAVSAVSKCHGMTHITWVLQHHMSLHILLQPMQICQQQIVGAHEVPDLQHNGPELLVVPSYRGPLPQVEQVGLVAEGVAQVAEFSLQGMAKILPCTNAQSSPVLISY